ncbi:PAS domain-containing protein [Roseococcus sp. SDR]|uniref:ATP-binding protein n=1 Tax=Roseococcus sp. SDR TaxID=2835532 RepID=UPI001BCC3F41|nr:ATP-binding protein [Roseococcus sp. SDR]MBS7788558.1 PAS domain-containing protein [Roseococcus sp. SDR]MBV1843872.1 PAS domain-containing protein [Roseococcus sp. SDR]
MSAPRLTGRTTWIAAAGLWLIILAAGSAAIIIFLRHEAGQLSREVTARCLSTVDALNQTLLRTLEAVQRVHALQQLQRDLEGRGEAQAARAISDHLTNMPLEEPSAGILQIAATDASGSLVFSSVPGWAPLFLGDRQHVRVHAGRAPQLYVSEPLVGRISGRWSLQLTYPLRDTEGRFGGVSIVSLDALLLSRRLAEISTAEGALSALMRLQDGALLARNRDAEAQLARPALTDHPAIRAARESPRGSFRAPSALDGRELLFCFRTVPEAELLVAAAEDWGVVSQSFVALRQGAWWSFALILLLLAGGIIALLRGIGLRATRRLLADAQAERAATASAWARLEQLLEAAPAAIYAGRLDEAGFRAEFASPNLRRVIGWPPEVFLDPVQAQRRMDSSAPAARADFQRRLQEEGRALMEYRWHRPDGSWRWLREEARRAGPDIVGYLLDVTEQRETAAWAAASARLNMLGELAANMAHELNQPLAVISLAAENAAAALDEDGPAGIPDARETLDLVAQQAARCKEVVQHLRLFSSPDERQSLADVRLETVVQGAMLLVRGALRDAGITLHNRLPAGLPPIRANAVGAEQVFVNLFLNARDALAGLPRDSRREIWITAAVEATDGRLVVRFADSGGGIPPELLGRVFEPFFTTKGSDKGTGLGLAICQSAMRGFGGDIRVRNGASGAEFTLDFPLAAPEPDA